MENEENVDLNEQIKGPIDDVTSVDIATQLSDCDDDEKTEKAEEFLRTIEDDSSWENDSYELSADEVLEYVDIIAEIEKEL